MISRDETVEATARRRLARLFPGDPECASAVAWAKEVLGEAGLDPSKAPLRSMRSLRRAERRLDLLSARYLVERAAGRPRRGPRGPRNPLLH